MKKTIILLASFLASSQFILAQTSTPVKITIGSSYVTTGYVNVHPYLSGSSAGKDDNFYFKLNVGTRFKVNQIIEKDGTIEGYVIVPWNFNDNLKKNQFYDTLIKSSVIKRQMAKLQLAITAKQDSLKSVQKQITQDSLNARKQKEKYENLKKKAPIGKQLFDSLVTFNFRKNIATKISKDPNTKKKVDIVEKAQHSLVATFTQNKKPDSAALQSLINAAKKLPSKDATLLKQYNKEVGEYRKELIDADQSYRTAQINVDINKNRLNYSAQVLSRLNSTFTHKANQVNDKKPDSNAYKATKVSKNYPLDSSLDTTDQAFKYKDLAYVDSWANGWLFFVSAKDFSDYAVTIYPSNYNFTWGFLTLPIKMRFDNNDGGRFAFEQNLNFGLTFGIKHQAVSTSDISWNYLLGLSVVNVPLDDATATTKANSTTALSPSFGFMFQYEKFQIGAFLGADFAGSNAENFKYQGKPWLGIAIGISLFGEGKTAAGTQTQDSGKP